MSEQAGFGDFRIGDLRISQSKLEEMRERNSSLDREYDRLVKVRAEIEEMYSRERGAAVFMSSKVGTLLVLLSLVLIVVNPFVRLDLVGIVLGLAVAAVYTEVSAARKMADACITRVMNCETSVALVAVTIAKNEVVRTLAHEEAVRNLNRQAEE